MLRSGVLKDCPNLIYTPHCAYFSPSADEELRKLAAQEIRRGLCGRLPDDLKYCVNRELLLACAASTRVASATPAPAPALALPSLVPAAAALSAKAAPAHSLAPLPPPTANPNANANANLFLSGIGISLTSNNTSNAALPLFSAAAAPKGAPDLRFAFSNSSYSNSYSLRMLRV